MSHSKQFTLYSHKSGPNGWKVAFVLEELGLTYHTVFFDFNKQEQKAPEFLKITPNGRIPALVDHKNGDFAIWESSAIIQYIVDKYDTARKLSVAPDSDEYYTQLQWLYFQASGQGPYFGQVAWFTWYHPEKVPSALERYRNEAKRVLGVLDSVLSKQKYLVADRLTVADIALIPWNIIAVTRFFEGTDFDFEKEYPAFAKWHNAIVARPAIKKIWDEREKAVAAK